VLIVPTAICSLKVAVIAELTATPVEPLAGVTDVTVGATSVVAVVVEYDPPQPAAAQAIKGIAHLIQREIPAVL
jgi:hypothetical protein